MTFHRLALLFLPVIALHAATPVDLKPITPLKLDFSLDTYDRVVGEAISCEIRMINQNTRPVYFGQPDQPETLRIEIRHALNREMAYSANNGLVISEPETLKPGGTLVHRVNLHTLYDLSKPAKYLVYVVAIAQGNHYETEPLLLNIVPGVAVKKATQMFASHPDLQRTFTLVGWQRNQLEQLFLRIEDTPNGKIWETIPLGALLRLNAPRIDISPDGEVTVLHRGTQHLFQRTLIWSFPNEINLRRREQLRDPENAMAARMQELESDIKAVSEKIAKDKEEKK